MVDFNELHIIHQKDFDLLFHYPSYSLIEINKDLSNVLNLLKEGNSVSLIAQKCNISPEDIVSCLAELINVFTKNTPKTNSKVEDDIVTRITLHISNDCNLRCNYCYASGGNYKMSRQLMTKETGKDFYKFCIDNFSKVESIVFFGGEPCLNIDIMEYICDLFHHYSFDAKMKSLPKFVIITNGTILNQRLINLINKYISFITVSLDGDKEINDFNRHDSNGVGSFDRASKFIDTVKQCNNVEIQFEATYTKHHLNKKISKDDIYSFLKNRFNIEGHIVDEISLEDSDIDKVSLENLDNLPIYFTKVLWALTYKKNLKPCPMPRGQFAVSTTGVLYPCHMDVGTEKLNLGSINCKNIFNSVVIRKSVPFLKIANKSDICPNCWAQNLCAFCPRTLFYDKTLKEYSATPNKKKCIRYKRYIEQILYEIAELRRDKDKWNKYVQAINNKKAGYECN